MDIGLPPNLAAFILASVLIELTPGPNMTWLAIVALVDGRAAGLRAVAGITAGLLLLGLLAALGVAELIERSPIAYEILRWAGIGFLVWLAWDGWRDRPEVAENELKTGYVTRGFFTNLLNPKAAIFYITVLPAFIAAGQPAMAQTMILTIAYVIVAAIVHSAIVILASQAARVLNEAAGRALLRKGLSLALFGVAVWFAIATARAG